MTARHWIIAATIAGLAACNPSSPQGAAGEPRKPAARDKAVSTDGLPDWRTPDKGHIGVVVARESVDVPTKIDGVIAEVKVGIGDRVQIGDPIAVIDDRPIREDLEMARAGARAARAAARRSNVQLAEARSRARRRSEGVGDIISLEEAESAKFAAQQAGASSFEAGASVAEQKTRVEQLQRMLTETTIVAPFAGTISLRYVDSGVLVPRGAPVVRLIAADDLWVRFAIPVEDAATYQVGSAVNIQLDSVSFEVSGVVRRIAPDLDPVSQMVTAEAELKLGSEQKATVQAGMAAWVNPAAGAKPTQLH